jgi:hypothetical protein
MTNSNYRLWYLFEYSGLAVSSAQKIEKAYKLNKIC